MDLGAARSELDQMLDSVSYELTEARRFGLEDPDRLRRALKKARDHLDHADALAAAVVANQDDQTPH